MRRYEVTFSVDFLRAKQRPRFDSRSRRTYTPDATAEAEWLIAVAYKGASTRRYGRVVTAPRGVPVELSVGCFARSPKGRPRGVPKWLAPRVPFVRKPDWDNLGKTVADALNGVAYADDAQVTEATVTKHDMQAGQGDRTDVTVRFSLPDEDEEGDGW